MMMLLNSDLFPSTSMMMTAVGNTLLVMTLGETQEAPGGYSLTFSSVIPAAREVSTNQTVGR